MDVDVPSTYGYGNKRYLTMGGTLDKARQDYSHMIIHDCQQWKGLEMFCVCEAAFTLSQIQPR